MEAQKRLKLLVVEDEKDIADLIVYNAEKSGFDAEVAYNGEDALKLARTTPPNLIILDLMLPGIDGMDVCRILKGDKSTAEIPIVMLTARGSEEDIVRGLELGADDYITKPFSPRVLFARINGVLRRSRSKVPKKNEQIVFENIFLDPVTRKVEVSGKEIELTFSEFEILHFLLRHPDWVFTRSEIVNNIREENYPVTERSIDVHIVGLRKKLGDSSKHIQTVRGVGYRLRAK